MSPLENARTRLTFAGGWQPLWSSLTLFLLPTTGYKDHVKEFRFYLKKIKPQGNFLTVGKCLNQQCEPKKNTGIIIYLQVSSLTFLTSRFNNKC